MLPCRLSLGSSSETLPATTFATSAPRSCSREALELALPAAAPRTRRQSDQEVVFVDRLRQRGFEWVADRKDVETGSGVGIHRLDQPGVAVGIATDDITREPTPSSSAIIYTTATASKNLGVGAIRGVTHRTDARRG